MCEAVGFARPSAGDRVGWDHGEVAEFDTIFILLCFSVTAPGLLWHALAGSDAEIQEWPLFITCRRASTQVSSHFSSPALTLQ